MAIEKISTDKLRTMNDKEGLVIQGCGGDLQEWIDGLNESLNECGILQNGSKFENGYTFKNEGVTCLFFPFDGVQCDIGKMAAWRLHTHDLFCGTWFTDYVDNRLGGFVKKPHCSLENVDGNIFSVMGAASKALRRAGMAEEAKEMCEKVTHSGDYYQALGIIMDYVDISSDDETENCDFNLSQQ